MSHRTAPGAMLVVVDRLVHDYADSFPAGAVARCVRSCVDDLAGSALTESLPDVVERLARFRLDQTAELGSPVVPAQTSFVGVPA